MPLLAPVIGSTEAEARDRADLILELTPDQVTLDLLSHRLGADLSGHDPDEIFSFDFGEVSAMQQSQSASAWIETLAGGRKLTLSQVYQAVAEQGLIVGTPEKVADHMEERFRGHAADGFIVMAPSLPSGLDTWWTTWSRCSSSAASTHRTTRARPSDPISPGWSGTRATSTAELPAGAEPGECRGASGRVPGCRPLPHPPSGRAI